MDLLGVAFLVFTFSVLTTLRGASGTTFTFANRCGYTVWPGVLSNTGSPPLGTTGFDLPPGTTRAFQAPVGWSGRFWGRTGCPFDSSAGGACATADCGSGGVECNGSGATPPVTLAEFTLGGGGGQDFYDVSLVDGYNLPMLVEASGTGGGCASTGCAADLNDGCPAELRARGGGGACRSACQAFGKPEYCCSGEFGSPDRCKPSEWSQVFKAACPRSYSYAFDDATSTFTCTAGSYVITFCPAGGAGTGTALPSMKSTSPPSTTIGGTTAGMELTFTGGSSSSMPDVGSSSSMPYTGSPSTPVMMQDDNQNPTWLATLATGDNFYSNAAAAATSQQRRRVRPLAAVGAACVVLVL